MRRRISYATACLTLAAVAVADEPTVVYNDLDVSAGGAWAEPVMLHRDTYAAWLAEPDYDTWTKYTDGTSVIACRPKIVRLTWGEAGRSLVFTNLVPGATYPWSVTKSDGTTLGGSFTTASAAPRWLSSPIFGWTEGGKETYTMNFRDLGGWELAGGVGKRTNFKVFYRSANLDRHFWYSDCRKGCPLSHEFHIKTELELRGDFPVTNAPAARIDDEVYFFTTNRNSIVKKNVAFTTSPCDDSGTIRYYRVSFSDGIKTSLGSATTEHRDAFRVLGKKANHPVVFHCAGGRDRTGLLAFLVEALVGMRETDLYRDHLSVVFAKQGTMYSSRVDGYQKTLYLTRDDGVERWGGYGPSLAGHVRAYLEWIGVTAEEIGAVTEALTGETPDQVLARVDAYETANRFRNVWYVNPVTGATGAVHRVAASEAPHDPKMMADDGKDPVRYEVLRAGYDFVGWSAETRVDDGNAVKAAVWRVSGLGPDVFDGDTFEATPVGTSAGAVGGWRGSGAIVNETPDPAGGFPVTEATHTNVLSVSGRATRTFSPTGRERTRYEMLLKVERARDDLEEPPADAALALAVDSAGVLRIWHGGSWVALDDRVRSDGDWIRLKLEERETDCRITVDGRVSPIRPVWTTSLSELQFTRTSVDDLIQCESLRQGHLLILR